MLMCLNCKAVFDEADQDERVIDRPCGEYGGYPKPVCPQCGSPELAEAFQCSECGEWFDADEREFHPYTELDVCKNCYFAATHGFETSPDYEDMKGWKHG